MPHLEDWYCHYSADPFLAPELRRQLLSGTVTGHPRHADGTFIQTSRPVGWDGEALVTKNSRYTLGKPTADYEANFPNARERLIASMPALQPAEAP